jgi:hypothetical protein
MNKAGRKHIAVYGVYRVDPPLDGGGDRDVVGLKIMLTEGEAFDEVQRLQRLYDKRVSKLSLADSRRSRYFATPLRLRLSDIQSLADTHLE